MKSTIRVDVDLDDSPVIKIRHITTSDDLRDKSLGSLLKKLGFTHALWNQHAFIQIDYTSWFGGNIDNCGEEFTLSPMQGSAKIIEPKEGEYITVKPQIIYSLHCNHPKVKRMWETGGLSPNPSNKEMIYNLHFILNDDTRKDFTGIIDQDVRQEAEKWLTNL